MEYIITSKTAVITPANSFDNCTIIFEENDVIYRTESPLTIIKKNCLHYGSTLAGRKAVAREVLNSKYKLPIPIKPREGLFFVPTISHRSEQCIWFSYFHVKEFKEDKNNLAVILTNNQVIYVDVSFNQFDLQMKRMSQVIAYFVRILCFT